jgi:CheY-like chemotaxis protein
VRVVVADDSGPSRLFFRRILIEAGHEVCAMAGNGKDALAQCAQHKPDLALLDRTMPGLGGDVVARNVLDNHLAKHVVMVSLDAGLSTFNDLIARGVQVLGKPLRKEQILRAIEALP